MNEEQNFEFLDILNILSFMAQMKNLEMDEKYEKKVWNFVEEIRSEVEKLHKENEEIIKKLDKVLNL